MNISLSVCLKKLITVICQFYTTQLKPGHSLKIHILTKVCAATPDNVTTPNVTLSAQRYIIGIFVFTLSVDTLSAHFGVTFSWPNVLHYRTILLHY